MQVRLCVAILSLCLTLDFVISFLIVGTFKSACMTLLYTTEHLLLGIDIGTMIRKCERCLYSVSTNIIGVSVLYIYIYIYICVCCVCVYLNAKYFLLKFWCILSSCSLEHAQNIRQTRVISY
jgi:hypothetical protein